MERIKMAHGNGGRYSHELMEKHILPYFDNPLLAKLHDGAQFETQAGRMAFTTDSYVVTPPFFPGGNIGKLAVCGTVNDLTMNGAIPQYLSCSLILEEGLSIFTLEEILATMQHMAKEAGVSIVTGDTKVVEQGSVDQIYINTAGVGYIPAGVAIAPERIKPDLDIILTGTLGDHAIAVMGTRYGLDLAPSIKTDCAPLNHMLHDVLMKVGQHIIMMRDPTRGGVATTLHELAQQGQVGILLEEAKIPVHEEVQAICGVLGYDPLYLANEGKALLLVEPEVTAEVLCILQSHPYGKDACHIGRTVAQNAGHVGLRTIVGGVRLLDALGEDLVPRIC